MTKTEILNNLPSSVKSTCPSCEKKTVFYGLENGHPQCYLCGYVAEEVTLPTEGFWVRKEDANEDSDV